MIVIFIISEVLKVKDFLFVTKVAAVVVAIVVVQDPEILVIRRFSYTTAAADSSP